MFFMNKPVPEYTAKIYDTYPWIIEHLDAYFDDVLCNLDSKNSFIYGGALRDTLAGLQLIGDLDLIIECDIFKKTVDIFRSSSKWMLHSITDGSKYERPFNPAEKKTSVGSITKIATFYDKANVKIQMISPTGNESDITDTIPCTRSAWDIVRLVDIRCSGVMLTLDGDIYEAVPGAIDDCRNRVLTINQLVKDNVGNKRLHKRVEKLVGRGWRNTINLDDYPITTVEPKEAIDIF